ncbi:MAG: nickel insertion protein [Terriglobales bacterium]
MATETILELVTTLDDCSPQVVAFVLERALAAGALDAYVCPVQMKKGRPGVLLTLLARPGDRGRLCELLLSETPTLGVRVRVCEREVRERHSVSVDTSYGPIRLTVSGEKAMPEYEDCRAAALRCRVPLARVQQAARAAWRGAQ